MQLVAFSPGTVTLTLRAEDTPAFNLSTGEAPSITLTNEVMQLVLEVGVPGSTGAAATVAVGSTTTLDPGLNATVTNSGTPYAAVLNFAIPRGNDGDPGEPGPAGSAATITVGTTTTLSPGASATVTNSGTSSAAILDFGIPSGSTIQLQAQVRNETGATLTKGTVVYINGAAGNKCTVTKAQASGEPTSAQTFGIIISDIPNNQNGYACVAGLLENLDTTAFTAGQQLYLSPTVAGGMTATKPVAPNHMVYVGVVERSHANQGTMQVRIANGFELEELHNVLITSPATGDLLVRSGSLWVNSTVSALGLATQAWVDAQGYLQSGALTGYALQSWVTAQGYITSSALTPYATLSSPSFTGDPKAPTPSLTDNDTSIATTAFVKGQGYLQSAVAAGTYYLQTNPAGYLTSSALAGYALQNGSSAFSVTGASIKSLDGSDNFAALDQGALNFGNGSTPSGIVINGSSITFADATVQTTAAVSGIPDAPSDGNTYGRNNGAWVVTGGGGGAGTLTYSSPNIYDTSTSSNISSLQLGTLTLTTGTGLYVNDGTWTSHLTQYGLDLITCSFTTSGLVLPAGGITFSDASTQTSAGITASAVASTYQTLAGMSSYAPKASPALTGVPTSTTAAADTNTTQIATTAFVVGQASASTPLVNSTAAIGTSLKYARADHVHPTDTSRAPLASPTFTGTVTIPAGASISGFAPLASPAFTGTPSLPTGTTAVTQTAGTNNTSVATTAFVTTAVSGAGGGGTNVQVFGGAASSGSFTWTKPANAKVVDILLIGAGGGGGSGARQATTSIRGGGGGGSQGVALFARIDAATLASTVSVSVGAGGAGGTAISVNSTNGASGSNGGETSFGAWRASYGALGNAGTSTAGGAGGALSTNNLWGMVTPTALPGVFGGGAGAATGGGTPTISSYAFYFMSTGGGGGAGQAANVTAAAAGGSGGSKAASTALQSGLVSSVAGGTGGTGAGVAAIAGTATNGWTGGTGGGGGYYITNTAGGTGAAGGWPGGGGGGGGASDNGFNSGAGGAGANGVAIIVTYF